MNRWRIWLVVTIASCLWSTTRAQVTVCDCTDAIARIDVLEQHIRDIHQVLFGTNRNSAYDGLDFDDSMRRAERNALDSEFETWRERGLARSLLRLGNQTLAAFNRTIYGDAYVPHIDVYEDSGLTFDNLFEAHDNSTERSSLRDAASGLATGKRQHEALRDATLTTFNRTYCGSQYRHLITGDPDFDQIVLQCGRPECVSIKGARCVGSFFDIFTELSVVRDDVLIALNQTVHGGTITRNQTFDDARRIVRNDPLLLDFTRLFVVDRDPPVMNLRDLATGQATGKRQHKRLGDLTLLALNQTLRGGSTGHTSAWQSIATGDLDGDGEFEPLAFTRLFHTGTESSLREVQSGLATGKRQHSRLAEITWLAFNRTLRGDSEFVHKVMHVTGDPDFDLLKFNQLVGGIDSLSLASVDTRLTIQGADFTQRLNTSLHQLGQHVDQRQFSTILRVQAVETDVAELKALVNVPRRNESTGGTVRLLEDLSTRVDTLEKPPTFTETYRNLLITMSVLTLGAVVCTIALYIVAFGTKSLPIQRPRSSSLTSLLPTTTTTSAPAIVEFASL